MPKQTRQIAGQRLRIAIGESGSKKRRQIAESRGLFQYAPDRFTGLIQVEDHLLGSVGEESLTTAFTGTDAEGSGQASMIWQGRGG